jgi:hypothetical protein
MNTNAFKTRAVVGADGSVTVRGLAFRTGESVRVVVAPDPGTPSGEGPSLRGSVIRYDHPTEPVAADDWEAQR